MKKFHFILTSVLFLLCVFLIWRNIRLNYGMNIFNDRLYNSTSYLDTFINNYNRIAIQDITIIEAIQTIDSVKNDFIENQVKEDQKLFEVELTELILFNKHGSLKIYSYLSILNDKYPAQLKKLTDQFNLDSIDEFNNYFRRKTPVEVLIDFSIMKNEILKIGQ